MEKRDLYDEKRNLTGETIYKGEPVPDGKYIIVVLIFIVLMLKNNAYAIEDEKTEYSKAYQQYLELSEEEKSKVSVIPRKYDVSMDILYKKQAENIIKSKSKKIIF